MAVYIKYAIKISYIHIEAVIKHYLSLDRNILMGEFVSKSLIVLPACYIISDDDLISE